KVRQERPHVMWSGIENGSRFYFVHSYFPQAGEAALVQGTTEYGVPFTCAVAKDNIFAVQFHPEKSHTAGLRLLANFVNWNPGIFPSAVPGPVPRAFFRVDADHPRD